MREFFARRCAAFLNQILGLSYWVLLSLMPSIFQVLTHFARLYLRLESTLLKNTLSLCSFSVRLFIVILENSIVVRLWSW